MSQQQERYRAHEDLAPIPHVMSRAQYERWLKEQGQK